MSRYAYVGSHTGELLSLNSAVIVHGDRTEMEWLCPGARVVRLTSGDLGVPTMQLRDHPDLQHLSFPLRREEFL